MKFHTRSIIAVLAIAGALLPGVSAADCVYGTFAATSPYGSYVFPNWVQAPLSVFNIWECDDLTCASCANSSIKSLTIFNYGTATGGASGDVTRLYFKIDCGDNVMAMQTMTYAGVWTVGPFTGPAWTWAGSLAYTVDPCRTPVQSPDGCDCMPTMTLYADIHSCPTPDATIALGPGYDDVSTTSIIGGLADTCNCNFTYTPERESSPRVISYIYKTSSVDIAIPGDTIDYAIYYGKPGTGNIDPLIVIDTMPSYVHLVPGSASPAPDPSWDPDFGPPMRLRWTFTGPIPTTGGGTGMMSFSATVDWGNGEGFEPGSGDMAAPEGEYLRNQAQLSWGGGGCASGRNSNPRLTVVRRYLFWSIGDNDVLFAPRLGSADDEMIYEMFVMNMSPAKTWWDAVIWDTVPAQLNIWGADCGFEDPCVGWTMTPTGCAGASPGRYVSGSNTILTWRLDLHPSMTLSFRWKARVVGSTPAGSTAVNNAAIMARGRTGVVGGTGHAGKAKVFIHEAQIVLRTTYNSYVGWAAEDNRYYDIGACVIPTAYYITFYPLNKATDFALYRKWCCGGAGCEACGTFHTAGGVSPTINTFAGSCTGGPATDWVVGCKAERAPARFVPSTWTGTIPSQPFNFLHKLVSNAPVIWELQTCFGGDDDAITVSGTTSLSYVGRMCYTWKESWWEYLSVGNADLNLPTTLLFFTWDDINLRWVFERTRELYNGSQYVWWIPGNAHVRIISSQTRIVVPKVSYSIGGNKDNDYGCVHPCLENGNLIASSAPSTYWVMGYHALVGNVGTTRASYEVFKYNALDPMGENPGSPTGPVIPPQLSGNAGEWSSMGVRTVDPGLAVPGNPDIYIPQGRLSLVKLLGGGPIQVVGGGNELYDGYAGGSALNAAYDDVGNIGTRTGREFWIHIDRTDRECGATSIQTVNIFCPKRGMAVNGTSTGGASATYTTNAPDQCVSFYQFAVEGAGDSKRNHRFDLLAGGATGNAIAQYIACQIAQKFYTAPFLSEGVFYTIITPPIVYSGQSFWITIIVMDTGGGTKDEYTGTTSFTATDPLTKIENQNMATYDFTWTDCPGTCGVRVFVNVMMTQLGLQTIVAADIEDGSITGLATVMVVGADVKLSKDPKFTIASSGETIQFRVCWSNYSSATATAFVITDAVPAGTTYIPEAASLMFCGAGGPATPTVTVAYGGPSATTPATFNTLTSPTQTAPSNTRWLRWSIQDVYVFSTGCVCFRVRVD